MHMNASPVLTEFWMTLVAPSLWVAWEEEFSMLLRERETPHEMSEWSGLF